MVKLEEKFPILNATVLGNEFKGQAEFSILQVITGDFFDKNKTQVKLILANRGNAYSLVLNTTNSDFLNKKLKELEIEPDSDNIPILSKVTIESYDTGGTGVYKYGIRITDFVLPPEQTTLDKTKTKSKKA